MKIRDAARVIRSKNAGPTQVSLDLMFDDPKLYERALKAASLRPDVLAQRFGVPEAEVIPYPAAIAIKIVCHHSVDHRHLRLQRQGDHGKFSSTFIL